MKYRMIGTDPATRREVSVLSLGAMLMGSRTDEATSFAILDRYVEAGGTFIDTSGNYAFWVNGTQGGESEEPLGRSGPYRASAQARWPGSGLRPVPRMPHEPRTPRHPRPQDRTRARTRHGNRSDGTSVPLSRHRCSIAAARPRTLGSPVRAPHWS